MDLGRQNATAERQKCLPTHEYEASKPTNNQPRRKPKTSPAFDFELADITANAQDAQQNIDSDEDLPEPYSLLQEREKILSPPETRFAGTEIRPTVPKPTAPIQPRDSSMPFAGARSSEQRVSASHASFNLSPSPPSNVERGPPSDHERPLAKRPRVTKPSVEPLYFHPMLKSFGEKVLCLFLVRLGYSFGVGRDFFRLWNRAQTHRRFFSRHPPKRVRARGIEILSTISRVTTATSLLTRAALISCLKPLL
jgi:hypothetical protein